MESADFDEGSFFRAVATGGARAILIGRRALIALGIPSLDDLESTKRFAARPKDAEDLRLLQALRARKGTSG